MTILGFKSCVLQFHIFKFVNDLFGCQCFIAYQLEMNNLESDPKHIVPVLLLLVVLWNHEIIKI